jgi:hypothetical protein
MLFPLHKNAYFLHEKLFENFRRIYLKNRRGISTFVYYSHRHIIDVAGGVEVSDSIKLKYNNLNHVDDEDKT